MLARIAIALAAGAGWAAAGAMAEAGAGPIDRPALVTRHNPGLRRVDPFAPLTVGNGRFACTVDVTGLQTFGAYYHANGIPLETLARWCWTQDENPQGYTLADVNETYRRADGTTIELPSKLGTPASDWLRRNPRLHPLGQLSLVWDKPDGPAFAPDDVREIEQTLDLWRGLITSRYALGGVPVIVTTACDPDADILAVRLESGLVAAGRLRVRLAFPRGHDLAVKNTPALDWSRPELHVSELVTPTLVERRIPGAGYFVACSRELRRVGPHAFEIEGDGGRVLELTVRFAGERAGGAVSAAEVRSRSAAHWAAFWESGAAVDFSGSTDPRAAELERRVVLSQYLTAVQGVARVPPQESGLTCNTWYGKHHTEMIWWHAAHFVLWGRSALAEENLQWFLDRLAAARALALERGLRGARWAKMAGPDGRESPGGNPLIVWNQPHPIHLAELLVRQDPSSEKRAKYRDLVLETADGMASMLVLDAARGRYVLGPPLWIAQEIHDPATSRNPSFELAYWRWGLETAQQWRVRSGLGRDPLWDDILARLAPLPQAGGRYVALESHPDTWDSLAARHDHPAMLMALGFLPATPAVDRATMNRTLDAVLAEWDWETKIWGWDYPMIAMTTARLDRPDDAVDVLLRDGPNNRYTASGHCPQRSDRAGVGSADARPEIAAYLPANGALLAAVALMVAGWDGGERQNPGFPSDGTWTIRAEGLQRLP